MTCLDLGACTGHNPLASHSHPCRNVGRKTPSLAFHSRDSLRASSYQHCCLRFFVVSLVLRNLSSCSFRLSLDPRWTEDSVHLPSRQFPQKPAGRMLPASIIRRVVTATPHSPVVSSFGSSSASRFAAFTLSCRRQGPQRRYSSSKPSRTGDNDAKDISTSQSAKPAAEKRKRKAKDENAAAASPTVQPLPFVPSTKLSPEGSYRDVTLLPMGATFYS